MTGPDAAGGRPGFRTTLVRVLAVEAIVVFLFWLVQLRYGR